MSRTLACMLADPGNNPQTTVDFACPEIVHYMNDITDENLGRINFTAQDSWSLGCLLVWLVTGQDPFACFNSELDMHKLSHLECMTRKQAAWVSFSSLLLQMSVWLLFAKTVAHTKLCAYTAHKVRQFCVSQQLGW